MGKTYRSYLPEQDFVLPPSLRDWLPEDHLAYFVSNVVDELDLSAVESIYEKEERGQPREGCSTKAPRAYPRHPIPLTALYCTL